MEASPDSESVSLYEAAGHNSNTNSATVVVQYGC